MQKHSKLLSLILISIFIVPQIALASWWNPFSWFAWKRQAPQDISINLNAPSISEEPAEEVKEISKATTTKESKISKAENKVVSKSEQKTLEKPPVMEKPTVPACDQACIDKQVNEKYQQEESKRMQAKAIEDERIRLADAEARRLSDLNLRRQESRRVTASSERVSSPSISTAPNNAVAEVPYSDYDFDYKWNGTTLSCPMTPRNIVIKKAVFKLSESEARKIETLKGLESDGFVFQTSGPVIQETGGANPVHNSTFNLEKRDANTYLYFGGGMRICGDGIKIALRYNGSLSDTSGRNMRIYLEQKNIPESLFEDSSGGFFNINLSPSMSEWEVWDNTTSKPVKVR